MPEENTIECLCHIFGEDQLTSVITDSSRLEEEQEVLQAIADSVDNADTPASNEYV